MLQNELGSSAARHMPTSRKTNLGSTDAASSQHFAKRTWARLMRQARNISQNEPALDRCGKLATFRKTNLGLGVARPQHFANEPGLDRCGKFATFRKTGACVTSTLTALLKVPCDIG
jgi:hypothetical protein